MDSSQRSSEMLLTGFPMNAELQGYGDQLLSVRQDAVGLMSGLSDAQFNWQPAPGRWSMGGCFDHLNKSAQGFIPKIDTTIAKAQSEGLKSNGPFAYSRSSAGRSGTTTRRRKGNSGRGRNRNRHRTSRSIRCVPSSSAGRTNWRSGCRRRMVWICSARRNLFRSGRSRGASVSLSR